MPVIGGSSAPLALQGSLATLKKGDSFTSGFLGRKMNSLASFSALSVQEKREEKRTFFATHTMGYGRQMCTCAGITFYYSTKIIGHNINLV